MIFVLPKTLGALYLHGMGSAGGMAVFYPGFLAVSVVFVGMTTLLAAFIAVRKVMKLSPIESEYWVYFCPGGSGHKQRNRYYKQY